MVTPKRVRNTQATSATVPRIHSNIVWAFAREWGGGINDDYYVEPSERDGGVGEESDSVLCDCAS